jgi:hypothetical protein
LISFIFPVCTLFISWLSPRPLSFFCRNLIIFDFKHLVTVNMKFSVIALAFGLVSLTSARRSLQHVGKKLPELKRNAVPRVAPAVSQPEKRQAPSFLTDATKSESAQCELKHEIQLTDIQNLPSMAPRSQKSTSTLENHMPVSYPSLMHKMHPSFTSGFSLQQIQPRAMRFSFG